VFNWSFSRMTMGWSNRSASSAISGQLTQPPRDNVTTLGWASFWSGLSQEMIYPLLPVFVVVALTSSKAKLGLIEGLLAVGATIARLISARALNRGSSPLKLTRGWYLLSLASRPLMALAPSVAAAGSLRVADGLGKGGKEAPKDVLVAADSKSTTMGRSFGIQTLLDTLGSVAGPVVAGALLLVLGRGEGSLRIVFALSLIPALFAVVFLWRAHDAPPQRSASVGGEPLPAAFKWLLAAVTIFGLANSSDTLLLLRAHDTGVSAAALAFLFAGFNLVYALLAVPAGALSDRIGRRPMILIAWGSYVITYVGFAFGRSSSVLVLLFLSYGVFYAAGSGVIKAWISTLVAPDRRGAALGLYAIANGVLVLPASLIAGVLWDSFGYTSAFLFGALTAVLALSIVALAPALRAAPEIWRPAGGV
jgi:MFS family permease